MQPKIFLSYAWANVNVADEIDNDFKAVGVTFQRDVRDINYTDSIKDFMNKIGKSDFVVMLISDEYIKSENCMYEVAELLNAHEFEKRILPVVVSNAAIFSRQEQELYYDYWQEKATEAHRINARHPNEKTLQDKRKVQNIYDYLGIFFQKVTDLKLEKFAALKAANYKPMLDKIGFLQETLVEQLIEISKTDDKEEKELLLERFLVKYPSHLFALFFRAFSAHENRLYKKAKSYYDELLLFYPRFAPAYNNLGAILESQHGDHLKAKQCYEKAISIDPLTPAPYYNLAVVLNDCLFEYSNALFYFEKTIELDRTYSPAHNAIAKLLQYRFKDYAKAKKHFQAALKLNPKVPDWHNDYGCYLIEYEHDFDLAIRHFKTAIRLEGAFGNAYYNLGVTYHLHLQDYKKAKLYYSKAIKISPNFSGAHYNLGLLLYRHFNMYSKAVEHLKLASSFNPDFANPYFHIGLIQETFFNDYIDAKSNYEKANKLEPNDEACKERLSGLVSTHFS